MRNDVITLISRTYVLNEYGVQIPVENIRRVYCDVASITQTEFYAANEAGLRPALRFDVFAYDYENEEIVEYDGVRYNVYRTYRRLNDVIELYVNKVVGVSG